MNNLGNDDRPLNPAWSAALQGASLFALDPPGCGGVALRAAAGPVRDRWLALTRSVLPAAMPWRRLPLNAGEDRLLGGLDLAATLHSGRPVAERGLLAAADGGVLLAAMAERVSAATAARLGAALDHGEFRLERDGISLLQPARFGLIALDEGVDLDERPPPALLERLAFWLDLNDVSLRDLDAAPSLPDVTVLNAARARLAAVAVAEQHQQALCRTAAELGVNSLRVVLLALRVSRAAAALAGRVEVDAADAALAARLVLAPRTVRLPPRTPAETPPEASAPESPPAENDTMADTDPTDERNPGSADDIVLAAAQAAIPADLLARLAADKVAKIPAGTPGRAGRVQFSTRRGRPAGTRPGDPRAGRLNIAATLRAAAPWQRLRGAEKSRPAIRRQDFRLNRFVQRSETVTLFVVDASGSSALQRLAEAKGAVELVLAECYVRRDQVALIAFRGQGAELLLPPTRSLLRAKRALARLPGGGGTPLAAALDAAAELAETARRRGMTPKVVLLTDGRANVGRDGQGGRAKAREDALDAARRFAALGVSALLVDTAPRRQEAAERLAEALGAGYLPLPYADAQTLSAAVTVS